MLLIILERLPGKGSQARLSAARMLDPPCTQRGKVMVSVQISIPLRSSGSCRGRLAAVSISSYKITIRLVAREGYKTPRNENVVLHVKWSLYILLIRDERSCNNAGNPCRKARVW